MAEKMTDSQASLLAKRRQWQTLRMQLRFKSRVKKTKTTSARALSRSISFDESLMRSALLKINNRSLAEEVQNLKIQLRIANDEKGRLRHEIIDHISMASEKSKTEVSNLKQELQRLKCERDAMSVELSRLGNHFFQSSAMILNFVNNFCTQTASSDTSSFSSTSAAVKEITPAAGTSKIGGRIVPSRIPLFTKITGTDLPVPMRVLLGEQLVEEDSPKAEQPQKQRALSTEIFAPNVSVIFEESLLMSPSHLVDYSMISEADNCAQNDIPSTKDVANITLAESSANKDDVDIGAKTSLELVDMNICHSLNDSNDSVNYNDSLNLGASVNPNTTVNRYCLDNHNTSISLNATIKPKIKFDDDWTSSHDNTYTGSSTTTPECKSKAYSFLFDSATRVTATSSCTKKVDVSSAADASPVMPFVTRRRTSSMRSSASTSKNTTNVSNTSFGENKVTPTGGQRRCRTSIYQALKVSGSSRRHTTQDDILAEALIDVPLTPSIPPPKKKARKMGTNIKCIDAVAALSDKENINERPRRQRRNICYEEARVNRKMRRQ